VALEVLNVMKDLPAKAAGTGAGTGVYVGISQIEYGNLAAPHVASLGPYTATGSPLSVAAGRTSFTFGLQGRFLRTPASYKHAQCRAHTKAPKTVLSCCAPIE
jgi:hypothetical protein